MKYYAVVEVTVTNPEWIPEYMANVESIIKQHGGKYLVRTQEIDQVEGDGDVQETTVILEFPSKEAAYGFYNSEEYKPFLEARLAGSKGKFYFVSELDEEE